MIEELPFFHPHPTGGGGGDTSPPLPDWCRVASGSEGVNSFNYANVCNSILFLRTVLAGVLLLQLQEPKTKSGAGRGLLFATCNYINLFPNWETFFFVCFSWDICKK